MGKHKLFFKAGIFLLFMCVTSGGFSQALEDKIFKPSVRTVLLHRTDGELTTPVINFNSEERLLLSFDDLEGGYVAWQYTLVHCNADWTPTDLWQNEYLQGYTDDYITEYKNSFNTLQPYTHYSLELPNRNIGIRLPGNYIVKVYADGDPEHPAFIRRFMVVDKRVEVTAAISQARNINQRYTHQDVSFSILNPDYAISEPDRQLKVVILQNFRWDNAMFNVKPLMLRSNEMDYHYTDGTLSFEAGNEFRFIDIKSLRYNTQNIYSIEQRNGQYYVNMMHDKSRAFSPYITLSDINGNFLIKTEDAGDVDDEGEYAWVNIFLAWETPLAGGTFYAVGAYNDWQHDKATEPEKGKMNYNYARQGYEARLYLKQGYYNYYYAFVDDKTRKIDLSQAEGNRFETGNSYTILVYNREQGRLFDRLIAVQTVEN